MQLDVILVALIGAVPATIAALSSRKAKTEATAANAQATAAVDRAEAARAIVQGNGHGDVAQMLESIGDQVGGLVQKHDSSEALNAAFRHETRGRLGTLTSVLADHIQHHHDDGVVEQLARRAAR